MAKRQSIKHIFPSVTEVVGRNLLEWKEKKGADHSQKKTRKKKKKKVIMKEAKGRGRR